jgi:two-component system response regulator YesN
MNVLIVDDQIHVARGVESGVDWQKLGVDRVFVATSMQQAQTVFAKEAIDIIITDIEMPMGNGLELISWVRQNHPRTECIFLTSHEDFAYARSAIKLDSFDYLIQPVQYEELAQVISRAIAKISQNTQQATLSQLGRYWQDNARSVRENFWTSILLGNYSINSIRLETQAEQLGITVAPPAQYLPMLINIIRRQVLLSEWDDDLLKLSFVNVLEEILFDQSGLIQVAQIDASHYIFLLPLLADGPIETMTLQQKMRFFHTFCQNSLKINLAVYIGEYREISGLAELFQALQQMDRKNVAGYAKVFILNNHEEIPADRLEFPEISHWEKLLENGETGRVWQEVQTYFARKVAEGCVDASFLARFQNEFLQMIWQISENRGVKNLGKVFTDQIIEDYVTSLENVDNMLGLIRKILTVPLAPSLNESDYRTTVEKVKAYIHANLDRELSRTEIAESVFLNPEYLSRLFRRETGQSLIEYITAERIQTAIGYLVRTNMPVSLIASKVGHSNFSHFSKIFKKATGLTPNEYRQTHARK